MQKILRMSEITDANDTNSKKAKRSYVLFVVMTFFIVAVVLLGFFDGLSGLFAIFWWGLRLLLAILLINANIRILRAMPAWGWPDLAVLSSLFAQMTSDNALCCIENDRKPGAVKVCAGINEAIADISPVEAEKRKSTLASLRASLWATEPLFRRAFLIYFAGYLPYVAAFFYFLGSGANAVPHEVIMIFAAGDLVSFLGVVLMLKGWYK